MALFNMKQSRHANGYYKRKVRQFFDYRQKQTFSKKFIKKAHFQSFLRNSSTRMYYLQHRTLSARLTLN